MAYGQKSKVVRVKQPAMAEGEYCAYGPTLSSLYSQLSQFLYAVKKWNQLLSSAEFKIRIVTEFIAPTVCANPITVICSPYPYC